MVNTLPYRKIRCIYIYFQCLFRWKTTHKLPLSIIVGYDGEVNTMKIWNYNRNRKELDIGAKKVDITVNDQIVFFGVIEKGCANTYTDYG